MDIIVTTLLMLGLVILVIGGVLHQSYKGRPDIGIK